MARAPSAPRRARHATMRELNRSLVLDVLQAQGPVSRADIAKATKLTKPTVSAIIDDLIGDGTAREIGMGTPTAEGGRPPILLEFNARSRFFSGVHIGVQRSTVVVADAAGDELGRQVFETPTSFEHAMEAVAGAVTETTNEVAGSLRDLGAVGVCVPGMVNPNDGVCLLAPNLGWVAAPVSAELEARLDGVTVHVHNTAQACAVAEQLDGSARGADDVVLLYAGTGVGAGILTDGVLYRGVAGIAGEIGHVRSEAGTEPCTCGKIGCLETVVSAPAVVRAAREAGVSTAADLTVEAVVEAARGGDTAARHVLDATGRTLGLAASWMVNLLNPEVLVVGGGMVGAGDLLMGPLRAAIAEHSVPQATEALAIRPWTLGQDAKVRGAVWVAMQQDDRSVRLAFGLGRS